METFGDGRELAVMTEACRNCHGQVRALVRALLADCFRSCRPESAVDDMRRITITAGRQEINACGPQSVRLTFADTGRGICDGLMVAHCKQLLRETIECSAATSCSVHRMPEVVWNGEVFIMTTAIEDAEIRRYVVRVGVDRERKEVGGEEGMRTFQTQHVKGWKSHSQQFQPEVVQLASLVKPRGAFSGSERSTVVGGRSFEDAVIYLESLCHKCSILNMKVLMELHLHHFQNLPGHERRVANPSTAVGMSHTHVTFGGGIKAPATSTNLERLQSGIDGYISLQLSSNAGGTDKVKLKTARERKPLSHQSESNCTDTHTSSSSNCPVFVGDRSRSSTSSRCRRCITREGNSEGVSVSRWSIGIGGAGLDAGPGSSWTPWTVYASVIVYLNEVVDSEEEEEENRYVPDGCSKRASSLLTPSTRGRVGAQVIFFSNFTYRIPPQSILRVLQNRVAWDKYGLRVDKTDVSHTALSSKELMCDLSMESLAAGAISKIDLIIHQYVPLGVPMSDGEKPSARTESRLVKQAVEMALDELKRNNPTIFDSKYQTKVRSCIPDLSHCVSSIVLHSMDDAFRQECAHLVGFQQVDQLNCLKDFICQKLETVVLSLEEQKSITHPTASSSSSLPVATSATSSNSNEDGSFSTTSEFSSLCGPHPMQVAEGGCGFSTRQDGKVGRERGWAKRRTSSPPPCDRIARRSKGRRTASCSFHGSASGGSDMSGKLGDDLSNPEEVSSNPVLDGHDLDFWS